MTDQPPTVELAPLEQKPVTDRTPFDALIEMLWKVRVGEGGFEDFKAAAVSCVQAYGLFDRLTPGFKTYDPRSETCPGELKIQLGTEGKVLIQAFFAEVPWARASVLVPLEAYKPGMEAGILRPEVFIPIINELIGRGMRAAEANDSQPKLVIAADGTIPEAESEN